MTLTFQFSSLTMKSSMMRWLNYLLSQTIVIDISDAAVLEDADVVPTVFETGEGPLAFRW